MKLVFSSHPPAAFPVGHGDDQPQSLELVEDPPDLSDAVPSPPGDEFLGGEYMPAIRVGMIGKFQQDEFPIAG